MRLSKRGWNNVLIFGVLLIIFIFNFSQQLRLSTVVSQRTVISSDLTIVEIETPDYVITRVGRNWESNPSVGLSSDNLQQIVNNWQAVPLDALTEQDLPTSNFVLKFFVTEQVQPIIVQLHQQQNDQYILQVDENSFLSLPTEKLTSFLGR
ncbi:hypothetical protein [Psychromonas sp. L1A2]|uniref:hypothetical protein n=1 Tax=Psychromonas sp. L1A2 TaxID=2686356 RepID=UPI00135ACB12|nr:hypothetical protein [Psychromonas sp. L1A2]